MRTKYILAGLIFAGFAICNCEKEKAKEIETDIFSVSYAKSSSWVDYSYCATIDQTGLVRVAETNGLTNNNRELEYQLTDTDLMNISEKLNDIIKIEISDQYGFDNKNAPRDLPITEFRYKTTMKSDSTSIYYPKENELPSDLNSFLQIIEQVIGRE